MEGMGWSGLEQNRKALERILALLFSLATLTERVALLPAPIRLPVLAVLGCCEAVARSFVLGLADDCGADARDAFAASSDTAGDYAGRIAARLRALALVLAALLALVRSFVRALARVVGETGQSPKLAGWQGFRLVPALDTS